MSKIRFMNAIVIDGGGSAGFAADVYIDDDIITDVVPQPTLVPVRDGYEAIECAGKVLCPGFIDIHTHSDFNVLIFPGMESSLSQGVTSEVFGNCGIAIGLATPAEDFKLERRALDRYGVKLDWTDLSSFLTRVADNGTALNVASLAGHGTLRKRVMGTANRAPDVAELSQMCRDAEASMAAGAIGLSSGLEYIPGAYASIDELSAIAKVVAAAGGFYATHLRDEGDHLEAAVEEAISVAANAGISLQLSHHKAELRRNWTAVRRTLARVTEAQASGIDIHIDQYPYTAYQTSLQTIVLPRWANAADSEALAELINTPGNRERIHAEMSHHDWSRIKIATCATHPDYIGMSLETLAANTGQHPQDFVLDLLATPGPWISAVHHAMSDEDVEYVLQDPRVMIGSDSVATDITHHGSSEQPHPRTFGTFARILGHYVREKKLIGLEEAIRKMTSLPASRLGWHNRGRIGAGFKADIVLLDPETVGSPATFEQPRQRATGISQVWVNGTLAHDGGRPTGSRSGQVYRK